MSKRSWMSFSLLLSSLFLGVCLGLLCPVGAQDWRGENRDQPNGYRASEFDSHYHGRLHEPAQQLNGYRASEARSHYGGSRFEPSSGWSYQQSSSAPGSAFSNQSIDSGGPGSAYSNASWYQNGGQQNSFVERYERAKRWQNACRNLSAAGYVPGAGTAGGAASVGGTGTGAGAGAGAGAQPGFSTFQSRLSTYQPMIEREQNLRQRAIESVESGQRGFGKIYGSQ